MSRQAYAVSIQIESELWDANSRALPEWSIFRVNGALRKQNENAYEPSTVAIGPYHLGKEHLIWMEDHKRRYLRLLLERRNERHVNEYIRAMKALEQEARKCYAESPTNLDSDMFVRMLLLDGCFILEFCRKFMLKHVRDTDPYYGIVQTGTIGRDVWRDLMLLENQLPFCVLEKLFIMTKDPKIPEEENINLVHLILCTFREILPTLEFKSTYLSEPSSGTGVPVPKTYSENSSSTSANKVDHLLSLIHRMWHFPSSQNVSTKSHTNATDQGKNWDFINCTTELREAGIKFVVAKKSVRLFDVKFEKGVLKIPRLIVTDDTETVFRNLIAYEQHSPSKYSRHITSYMVFMDRLMNTAMDVEQLRKKKIISNWLGDDEAVSTMFNKLGNHVELDSSNFCYTEVFNEVNKHCAKRRNIWLVKLNRNYFNSPWSIISFLAATALLVLTLLQTIFSILSYINKS